MKEHRRLILLSLCAGICIMLAKFTAFFITHSNAILTDAAESIVNVLASGFAFYSIYLSFQPRDENHPYGHGKVEFFSVFLEGGLIFLAGVLIVGKAFYNLFFPETLENLMEGIGIITVTGLINFVLGAYLIKKGTALNSITIVADGKHLQVDAYSTCGLLVGLGLIYLTKFPLLDSILSLGLGLYILVNGYKLLRKSIGGLMDESDFELVNKIVQILDENRRDCWIDIHNLRVQRYGHELHVDCHVTLPNYYDLNQSHMEVSTLDQLINKHIGEHTELFVHADPCLPPCCHYCRVKNCPIRSEEKNTDFKWDMVLVTKNEKHFDQEIRKKK